jgi:hypothetical protein
MPPLQCQACGKAVPYEEPIPRDSDCEGCHRDLRCCMNCRHHDPTRNNSCRETEAELVEDKARRNFCEFFSFNRRSFVAGRGDNPREAEARARLESLFGGPITPGAPRPSDARKKLDGLFGKPTHDGDDE